MTVVVREPEWTDDDRMQMRELDIYEAGLHDCGVHRSLLEDKSNVFAPEAFDCPVCASVKRYAKMLRRGDDQRRDRSDPYAPDPADGRTIHVRQLSREEAEAFHARQRESAAVRGG